MSLILKEFLSAAGIVHTDLYADNVFYSHPNRGNLLGLKQMLSCYGVEMEGMRVADRNVKVLTFPCILHVRGDFVVATACDDTYIIYKEQGTKRHVEQKAFGEMWDGYALVRKQGGKQVTAKEGEPDYEEHRRTERMQQLPWWGLLLVLCGILALGSAWQALPSAAMALLALMGVGFSFFLAEKEVHGVSRIGDKLCKVMGEGACGENARLKKKGFLWGMLSLSEVGLGYFSAQLLSLSFWEDAYLAVAVVGVFAMLFCPWSIVVQWRMKQWCVLCLLVVAVLVMQGLLGIYTLNVPDAGSSAAVVLMMALGIVVAHLIVQGEHQRMEALKRKWAFQAFRDERVIFETKLKSRAPKQWDERNVTRRVGNEEAPHRVTVVTSADCQYCQVVAPQIEKLSQQCHDGICVDYVVLSEMSDEAKYGFIQRTGINATPTILVDGYELPEGYEVGELLFLLRS